LKTENLSFCDGLGSILTRRVEHGKHTEELPFVVTFLDSDTESTETTTSELGGLVTVEVGGFLGAVGQVEDSLGSTLGSDVSDTVLLDFSGNTLGDRVEGSVLDGLPAFLEDITGFGVTLESENGNLVDRVERLDVVGRSESGNSHHPVNINTFSGVRLADGKLVGSQSTGLVRAENVDTSKRLDSSKLLDDSLLLSEVSGTDGESCGGNDGKTDGDTDNEKDKDVVEQVDGRVFGSGDLETTEETTDPGSDNPEDDENEKRSTNVVHDSLEVTLVLGTLNESSSATNERTLGRCSDETIGLSTLATSSVVDSVTHELVDSERLSGNGRLVRSDDGVTLVVVLVHLVLFLAFLVVLVGVVNVLLTKALPFFILFGSVVVTNEVDIGRGNLTFFNNDLKRLLVN